MTDSGNKRRIIFASGGLYPGGTSEFVSNILEGLPAHGWQCSALVVSILAGVGEELVARGRDVLGPFPTTGLLEDSIGAAWAGLASRQPQVVVASLGRECFELLRMSPPDVLRVGMIQSDEPGNYETIRRYARWVDVVGCVSLRACERMAEVHPEIRAKIEYLPYGVRMREITRPPAARPGCRIVYLGRLIEEQKRMGLQTQIMEQTLEADPDLVWTLVGDGPERGKMEARLARWGERVRFLGHVPNEKIPGLLAEQDLFFLCSDYEGLPLSLLEAMGAGVVPVVSDLPSGIRQVVDESTGVRVDPGDPAAYVKAVLEMAADHAKRASLSAECHGRVKDLYSIDAMAKNWADMLERRLEARHWASKWPGRAMVPQLLGHDGDWRFLPALRPLRRLGKSLKKKLRTKQS